MESINFETFLLHLQPPTLKVQDTNKHVWKWISMYSSSLVKYLCFIVKHLLEETGFYLTTYIWDFSELHLQIFGNKI